MKTLGQITTLCDRIGLQLDQTEPNAHALLAYAGVLSRVADDVEQHVRRAKVSNGQILEAGIADESLKAMRAALLWLQEYGEISPEVVVSGKVRAANRATLRAVALLQRANLQAST
jgi:hypothetical protein